MGQRLLINFTQNDETVVALYQKWSGFTGNALEILRTIAQNGEQHNLFNAKEKISPLLKTLLTFAFIDLQTELECEHVNFSQWLKYISPEDLHQNMQRKQNNLSWNDGLVMLFPSNIDMLKDWSEMVIDIPLETFEFNIGGISYSISEDEFDTTEHDYLFPDGSDISYGHLVELATELYFLTPIIRLTDEEALDDLYRTFGAEDTPSIRMYGDTSEVFVAVY